MKSKQLLNFAKHSVGKTDNENGRVIRCRMLSRSIARADRIERSLYLRHRSAAENEPFSISTGAPVLVSPLNSNVPLMLFDASSSVTVTVPSVAV